jgi:hypothetical protein
MNAPLATYLQALEFAIDDQPDHSRHGYAQVFRDFLDGQILDLQCSRLLRQQ